MLSEDFMCAYSPFLIAFYVLTGLKFIIGIIQQGPLLDRPFPNFEFLSGSLVLQFCPMDVFFCCLTQPRLVLLGNTVSAFLEAAVCSSATTLSIQYKN